MDPHHCQQRKEVEVVKFRRELNSNSLLMMIRFKEKTKDVS